MVRAQPPLYQLPAEDDGVGRVGSNARRDKQGQSE